MRTIIVTRHPALVSLLKERGLVTGNERVITHANAEDVRGMHVIGVLPMALAAIAESVTEIELALTPEMRGKELDLDALRLVAGNGFTYKVHKCAGPTQAALTTLKTAAALRCQDLEGRAL